MGSWWLLPPLGLVGMLGACVLPGGSDGEVDGLEALRAARAEARAACYLVVRDEACCNREGRAVHQGMRFAPGLTVISQNGRLVLWARRDVAYTLRRDRGCYERQTQFSRGDLREVRRTTVVPYEVDEARVRTIGGRTLIRWQVDQGIDSPGIEGRLRLDRSGRPAEGRERTMRWGPSRRAAGRFVATGSPLAFASLPRGDRAPSGPCGATHAGVSLSAAATAGAADKGVLRVEVGGGA
jgi:hypothetical protein